MKILVIRFRQMGDAILVTPLLSTLKQNIPDAEIDFVLNDRIAPLFEGHPALHSIITFSDEERHNWVTYIRKVWRIVHATRYDAVIDLRSTTNTILFSLFSLRSRWRIGVKKPYTGLLCTHRYLGCREDESMIDHNLCFAKPLLEGRQVVPCRDLSLSISDEEKASFRRYMEKQGIDFSRPVLLVGVTAKLENKTWAEDRMVETLSRVLTDFSKWQLIFNYAPGKEAENARRISEKLGNHKNIFLNVEATSPRQMAAMAVNCDGYFGNEGGGRHIVHAMGKPSLVICSPMASKTTWLPDDTNIPAWGIAASDICDTTGMSYEEQYDKISIDHVWPMLERFLTMCNK